MQRQPITNAVEYSIFHDGHLTSLREDKNGANGVGGSREAREQQRPGVMD